MIYRFIPISSLLKLTFLFTVIFSAQCMAEESNINNSSNKNFGRAMEDSAKQALSVIITESIQNITNGFTGNVNSTKQSEVNSYNQRSDGDRNVTPTNHTTQETYPQHPYEANKSRKRLIDSLK